MFTQLLPCGFSAIQPQISNNAAINSYGTMMEAQLENYIYCTQSTPNQTIHDSPIKQGVRYSAPIQQQPCTYAYHSDSYSTLPPVNRCLQSMNMINMSNLLHDKNLRRLRYQKLQKLRQKQLQLQQSEQRSSNNQAVTDHRNNQMEITFHDYYVKKGNHLHPDSDLDQLQLSLFGCVCDDSLYSERTAGGSVRSWHFDNQQYLVDLAVEDQEDTYPERTKHFFDNE